MKKKILLMNTNFGVGGISASMINTANELSKLYNVSIFCLDPIGVMKERLSDEITIIDSNWRLKAIVSNLGRAQKLGLKYLIYKVFARVWSMAFDNRLPIYLAIRKQKELGRFDLACSYTHEQEKHLEYTGLIRVLISKVDSPIKMSWVHCDYNFVKQAGFNNRYYNKMNAIVGVTQSVADVFKNTHPGVHVPILTCPNMLDYENLYSLADEPIVFEFDRSGIICFSACRLSQVKGIERAIRAFGDILEKNNVYWYIAGGGSGKDSISLDISRLKLENRVILLGETTNPFRYMKKADLYINVSYQEAAPLVFMEAKALHLPVFATRTLSAEELLDNEIDYICDNDEVAIREAFKRATSSIDELKIRKYKLDNYVGNNDRALGFFEQMISKNN